MVEVFRKGDIFGEMSVLDGDIRSAEAVTDGSVRLLRIGAASFVAVLQDTPALGENLCRILAVRLRRTFGLLQDATFETVETRLARQVLYLARQYGQSSERGWRVGGRFRQTDLADLLGTTPRSIITTLNRWRTSAVASSDQISACRAACPGHPTKGHALPLGLPTSGCRRPESRRVRRSPPTAAR
jgi:CRP/FNR family cyclic AMP-dependent transcriptional regulator